MRIPRKLNIGEFAALIAESLRSKGIDAVLTGGAVVSIYSDNKYQSSDADFISANDQKEITDALLKFGFQKESRSFVHPDTTFFVEFPPGPLAIGSQQISTSREMKIKGNRLKLLSPTHCVMDRLAAYIFWNDRQSLDQALWVAAKHPINMRKVKSWAETDGGESEFNEFLALYRKSKSST